MELQKRHFGDSPGSRRALIKLISKTHIQMLFDFFVANVALLLARSIGNVASLLVHSVADVA